MITTPKKRNLPAAFTSAFAVLAMVFSITINITAQVKEVESIAKGQNVEANELAPTPTPLNGNPSCASINPAWGEYKLDFSSPNGTFPFTAGSGRTYSAGSTGLAQNPNLFINVSSSGATMSQWSLSPVNQIDRLITYVIVKGGPSANGYSYPTGSIGDTGPFTTQGARFGISHISFCFDAFSGPSSAPVTVSGRVLTSDGNGIAFARVEAMDLSSGNVTVAMTNQFGYYAIRNLEAEAIYMVTANHKRYTFINNQRTITPSEDLVGVDFVAP